ncbi:hypothetical protein PMAYCL1PPCAC_06089, partial [Pristionchus mayeri]
QLSIASARASTVTIASSTDTSWPSPFPSPPPEEAETDGLSRLAMHANYSSVSRRNHFRLRPWASYYQPDWYVF